MCRKSAGITENVQNICWFWTFSGRSSGITENVQKSAGITANVQRTCRALQKICRYSRKYAEYLQVLLKICRKSADVTANVQRICRYYRQSAGRSRKSASVTQYWKSCYAKNKVHINQRLRNRRQRKVGAWDQESEKLEMSRLVPSGKFVEHRRSKRKKLKL